MRRLQAELNRLRGGEGTTEDAELTQHQRPAGDLPRLPAEIQREEQHGAEQQKQNDEPELQPAGCQQPEAESQSLAHVDFIEDAEEVPGTLRDSAEAWVNELRAPAEDKD